MMNAGQGSAETPQGSGRRNMHEMQFRAIEVSKFKPKIAK
jgi:hypothetical protein